VHRLLLILLRIRQRLLQRLLWVLLLLPELRNGPIQLLHDDILLVTTQRRLLIGRF
jgi:hypothetical protein